MFHFVLISLITVMIDYESLVFPLLLVAIIDELLLVTVNFERKTTINFERKTTNFQRLTHKPISNRSLYVTIIDIY